MFTSLLAIIFLLRLVKEALSHVLNKVLSIKTTLQQLKLINLTMLRANLYLCTLRGDMENLQKRRV